MSDLGSDQGREIVPVNIEDELRHLPAGQDDSRCHIDRVLFTNPAFKRRSNKLAEPFHGLATLGHQANKHLPHVPHTRPHIDLNLTSTGPHIFGKAFRVAQQQFVVANLDESRW